MSLSHKNQTIDLQSNPMDWFLYDKDLRHERVNSTYEIRVWKMYANI